MRRLFLALLLVPALLAQQPLFWRNGNLAALGPGCATAAQALQRLCAGLSQSEQQAGYRTALPAGTQLLAYRARAAAAQATFDANLLLAANGTLEDALEQINKTALSDPTLQALTLFVQRDDGSVVELGELLGHRQAGLATATAPLLRLTGVIGALSGKRIAISPGHGYYWHSTLGWTTQRGAIDGLTEDIHTAEICNQYLIPMLENLGAEVVLTREHGEVPLDAVADNDGAAAQYSETGSWSLSASSGYNGGSYRYVGSSASATATATWTLPVSQSGLYPVYAWYRAGSNRSTAAQYLIHHSGGSSAASLDQTKDNLTWVHLGDYWFSSSQPARIELSNAGTTGTVVVADAVRLGGGLGSIVRGTSSSNHPAWQECARYWAQFAGAPSSVYDSATGEDNNDDVTARPRFAEWRTADAFVSLHTNAGGGAGTNTFIYNGGATAGSAALSAAVHNRVIADLRAEYNPSWVDRGQQQANFGELRLLATMPGILLELAFHDTPGSVDHQALHDPNFRQLAARAIARGVMEYFAPTAPFSPEAPTALRFVQDGSHGLRAAWDPVPTATHYTVELSSDGKGFVVAATTTAALWSTGPLPFGTVRSVRVRAWNSSGRSLPSEVLTAGTDHLGRAEVLLVQGFDRLERTVKGPENTHDYLAFYGAALREAAHASLAFDATSNEALTRARIALAPYQAVLWSLGEESTAHETFSSSEQSLVTSYLQSGGALLVSGAEVGWDLDALGSAADRAFYRGMLGASYVADDAATYNLAAGIAGSLTAGLAASTFANSTANGLYNVDYPDVLAPADANSLVCLRYGNGLTAGLQRIAPSSGARVVQFGFPLETLVNAQQRAQLLQRCVEFLLPQRSLHGPASSPIGQTLPLHLHLPSEAGLPYLCLCSDGTDPPIGLPSGAFLPLRSSFLIGASLDPSSAFFANFLGTLNASGGADPSVAVPYLPWLVGSQFSFAAFTIDPSTGLDRSVTAWVRTTLTF